MEWYHRVQKHIKEEYDEGNMSNSEFNKAMRDLDYEYEQARKDAAEQAYNNY